MLLDVGYAGSRGSSLPVAVDMYPVPAKYLSTSPVRDQPVIDSLSRQVSNPFFGLPEFAGSNLAGRTVATSQLLYPYPHFASIQTSTSTGRSIYHSLQVRAEKRFSHGYTLQANYTWSKFIDMTQLLNPSASAPHRVISRFDRPHSFVATGIYEIPFGRGKQWLSSPKWLDYLVGGWSFQAIYQGLSGPPIDLGNVLFMGDIKNIPLSPSQRTVDRWFNIDAGFERAPQRQLASNIRTFPIRLNNFRGPGYNIWNGSLIKSFRLREGFALQVRAEVVDLLNKPQFLSPNADPTNSLFGQVTSIGSGTQRRTTLGAKLTW